MLSTLLILLLILLFYASVPTWSHSRSWGYYPSGGIGIVLAIVIVLVLMGRL